MGAATVIETPLARRREWLVALAVLAAVLLAALYVVAVHTGWGQDLDDAALDGRTTRPAVLRATGRLLDTISVSSLTLLGGAALAVATARGRLHLALTAGVVVLGANLTTQLLKHEVLSRPMFAGIVDPLAEPSFPSGHATVAMSLAVAFLLVVPARARGVTALCGLAYACLVGTGTVTAGWHRPSDVMAGFLVVMVWAGLATAVLIAWRGTTRERNAPRTGSGLVSPTLAWSGAGMLAVGFLGFVVVSVAIRENRLDAVRLGGAYTAALLAIVGVGLLLMAAFLAAVRDVALDPPVADADRASARA